MDAASTVGTRFASAADYAECRRLHRRFGTTYYAATRLFPKDVQERTHAVYGFVRVPDEWVDNPDRPVADIENRLLRYRWELIEGLHGVRPESPVLRAFCDVARGCRIPAEVPLRFLDAMEQDLRVSRYPTYDDLRTYMNGSAASVGLMMCSVLGAGPSGRTAVCATALGEAMQLTNFLRDVGEDAKRGRVYLPLEDLAAFQVSESQIFQGRIDPQFVKLMRFEIERARGLYGVAREGIDLLPARARKPVWLAAILYSRILDHIEDINFQVFGKRAHTSLLEKAGVAARVMAGFR